MEFITEKVDKNEEGSRLDKYLMRKLKNLSFTSIVRFVRKKYILLNGKRVKAGEKLTLGDQISYAKFLTNLNEEDMQSKNHANSQADSMAETIKNSIIFEDKNIIAINKPSGVAVQRGSKLNTSIADGISHINKEYRIVHRLDKMTTGVLIIAKNLKATRILGECFKERECSKTYLAVCTGKLPKKSGEIHYPLLKKMQCGQEIMVRSKDGLPSQTRYHVLEVEKSYSLVELMPITGRKHQIRAHLSILSCPVVGDTKYGGKKNNHLMLHAKRINFKIDDEIYSIEAEMPEYFIFSA